MVVGGKVVCSLSPKLWGQFTARASRPPPVVVSPQPLSRKAFSKWLCPHNRCPSLWLCPCNDPQVLNKTNHLTPPPLNLGNASRKGQIHLSAHHLLHGLINSSILKLSGQNFARSLFPTSYFRLPTSDFRLPTSDFRTSPQFYFNQN